MPVSKEHRAEYMRKYYEANKERMKANNKKWIEEHRERFNELIRERRRLLNAEPEQVRNMTRKQIIDTYIRTRSPDSPTTTDGEDEKNDTISTSSLLDDERAELEYFRELFSLGLGTWEEDGKEDDK